MLQSLNRIIDNLANDSVNYDTLIDVLSLFCLISILNRHQPSATPVPQSNTGAANAGNPLQKLLGDLMKGDGNGPPPDALMSLLPLLNSPQLKSKLNPANISAILGMLNNFGGGGGSPGKHEHPKNEKTDKTEKKPTANNTNQEAPAAAVTSHAAAPPEPDDQQLPPEIETEKKSGGGSLNWKSNF